MNSKLVTWSRPDGLGIRYAVVNGRRYKLERTFYKNSRGEFNTRFWISNPEDKMISGIYSFADAKEWLKKAQQETEVQR